MSLKENMDLAKQAIRFTDRLGITSINVPFRIGSYYGSPLSKFDLFMLRYMRTETSTDTIEQRYKVMKGQWVEHFGRKLGLDEKDQIRSEITNQQLPKIQRDKVVRSQILQIIHSTASKGQKKKQLHDLMKQTNFDPDTFGVLWHFTRTNAPDEERIRAVRKAVKFRHGNCGEKAAIAVTWLLEQTKNSKALFWVNAKNWDHAWGLLADPGLDENTVRTVPYKNWPKDVVVVDGWTSDWYPIHHPWDPIKGTAANPFQLYVRKKVQAAATQVNVKEELEWPPVFAPTFSMERAGEKNSTYEHPPMHLLDVLDNPTEVEETVEESLIGV
jgi:hypothetical protein